MLDEIEQVASVHDVSRLPSAGMIRRMVVEKRAFSYARDGLVPQAVEQYAVAIAAAVSDGDERGALKSRGGLALCRASNELAEAVRELRSVAADSAAARFGGVQVTPERNADLLEAGGAAGDLEPFEVV